SAVVGALWGMGHTASLIAVGVVVSGIHYSLQTFAGAFSVVFGLWYAYATGFVSGLCKTIS
ncbi:MAG TPA: hypothetical protein VES69_15095, partial [Pyrinomonadaceae bacterium]|nr:hypothetical protein [Pyrinomonadaceae bacterium]